jgi:hypothetical protein
MGGHPLQRARGVEQLASGLNDGDAMLAHKDPLQCQAQFDAKSLHRAKRIS